MDWFDELDLDPASSPLRMRLRPLGRRPWLVVDDRRADELAVKQQLAQQAGAEVFAAVAGSEAAGAEVLGLVGAVLGPVPLRGHHPLQAAGLATQEDLCLLQQRDGAWHLDAASVSFPSRWRLADKLGRPVAAVHGPVPGYAERLASRVDRLLDRLGPQPVWRRNWHVHPDGALHQPDPPAGGDRIVPARRCGAELWVRSERQTLRRLGCGWVLFTIRVQQVPFDVVADEPGRAASFGRYLEAATPAVLAHRGMAPAQVAELREALALPAR